MVAAGDAKCTMYTMCVCVHMRGQQSIDSARARNIFHFVRLFFFLKFFCSICCSVMSFSEWIGAFLSFFFLFFCCQQAASGWFIHIEFIFNGTQQLQVCLLDNDRIECIYVNWRLDWNFFCILWLLFLSFFFCAAFCKFLDSNCMFVCIYFTIVHV